MISDELLRWFSADKLCCRLIKVAGCLTAPGNNFLLFFCSAYWHSLAGLRALWTPSMCFPNLKIILQSGPSVFKFNLKWTVIFCKKNFSHLQPPQAGRVGTNSQFFESVFYKSDFKSTCWASPKPNIQHKIVLAVPPRWHWICKFSWRKNYFRKIDIDSFNIASNRSYYFRFWR